MSDDYLFDTYSRLMQEDQPAPAPAPQTPEPQTPEPRSTPINDDEIQDFFQNEKRQQDDDTKQRLRMSLMDADGRNPDHEAEVLRLSKKLNVNTDFVARHFDDLSKHDRVNDIKPTKIMSQYERTAQWLANNDNAKIAGDDHAALTGLEQKVQEHGTFSKMFSTVTSGIYKMGETTARIPSLLADVGMRNLEGGDPLKGIQPGELTIQDPEIAAATEKYIKESSNNPAAIYFQKKSQEAGEKIPELSDSAGDALLERRWIDAARIAAYQALNNAPNLVTLVTIAAVTKNPTAGLAYAGATSAADAHGEALEKGAKPQDRVANALVTGTVEAVFENLGTFGILKRWEKEAGKYVGKKMSKEYATMVGKQLAYSVASEGNEEFWTSIAQDASKVATGVDSEAYKGMGSRALSAGLVGGVSGAGLTSIHIAATKASAVQRVNQEQKMYTAIEESARESKVSARAPESFADYVNHATEGTGVSDVYVPVEQFDAYFQKKGQSSAAAAYDLGFLDEFNEAKETGKDIKIPLSIWATKDNVDSEHYQALRDHIKFSEDGPTLADVKKIKALDDEAKVVEAELTAQNKDELIKQYSAEADNIFSVVSKQLEAAGESSDSAKTNALLFRSIIRTLGLRTQTSPQELFDRYGLRINRYNSPEDIKADMAKAYNQRIQSHELDQAVAHPMDITQAESVLSQIDTPEKAVGLTGDARVEYLAALHKKFGDVETRALSMNYDPKKIWYHGTNQDFDKFDLSKARPGSRGAGVYVSDSLDIPEGYGRKGQIMPLRIADPNGLGQFDSVLSDADLQTIKSVLPEGLHSNLANNFDLEAGKQKLGNLFRMIGMRSKEMGIADPSQSLAEAMGISGIDVPGREQVIFDPSKIRSAHAAFDPRFQDSDLILAQNPVPLPEIKPTFYSKLVDDIETKIKGKSATVEQIKAILKDIKEDERKWSGIDEYLKDKTKVDTKDLLDFLRANQIEIVEVTKGGEVRYLSTDDFYINEDVADMEVENLEAQWDFNVPDYLSDSVEYITVYEFLEDGKRSYELSFNGNTIGSFATSTDFLNAIQEKITADTGQRFSNRSEGEVTSTNFSEYTLPGGENYREILFTMPAQKDVARQAEFDKISAELKSLTDKTTAGTKKIIDEGGDWQKASRLAIAAGYFTAGDVVRREELKKRKDELFLEESKSAGFTSSHFDEKNILAHTRLQDFTDADGKRVLLVEEIQSDWHQAGRKKGYKGDAVVYDKIPIGSKMEDFGGGVYRITLPNGTVIFDNIEAAKDGDLVTQDQAIEKGLSFLNETNQGKQNAVPDAPFKKTWHEFVLKRLIREAAEKGYDRIAWTAGEQQAERYDLSKQIGEIKYKKYEKTGTYKLEVNDKEGTRIYSSGSTTEEKIEEVVGKEMAKKIVENATSQDQSLTGLDLKVGGEGMKGFYDKILVNFASKFVKKYDAKVGETKVESKSGLTDETKYSDPPDFDGTAAWLHNLIDERGSSWNVTTEKQAKEVVDAMDNDGLTLNEALAKHGSPMLAEAIGSEVTYQPAKVKVHSIDITPALRDAALYRGFTLFQPGDDSPQGQIRIGKSRQINIDLFKNANRSTFLHEMGHFYLEIMGDLANQDGMPNSVKDDFGKILEWLGVESRDQIEVEHHEKWARGFEAYLMEGKAPAKSLRKAFGKFKAWLMGVYKTVSNIPGAQINDEIRGVFDRMIAVDEEITKASGALPDLMNDQELSVLSEKDSKKLREAVDEAKQSVRERVTAKILTEHAKQFESWWKEETARIKERIRPELESSLIYRALANLQRGKLPSGEPLPDGTIHIKLSKADLVAQYGKEILNRLPRPYIYSKDGVSLSAAAELLGFSDDVDGMIQMLANTESLETVLDKRANDEMHERFGDKFEAGQLPQEVVDSIHNEKRAHKLRLELEYLSTKLPKNLRDAAGNLIRRAPRMRAITNKAKYLLSKKPLDKVKPHIYMREERKAAAEASALYKKGDILGAFQAKEREMINHELYREALKAKDVMKKANDLFKKIFGSDEEIAKSREMDIVSAARSMLAAFNLGGKEDRPASYYIEKIKDHSPGSYAMITNIIGPVSAELYADGGKELSYSKFLRLYEMAESLWHVALEYQKIEIEGKRFLRKEAIAELIKQDTENGLVKDNPAKNRALTAIEKAGQGLLSLTTRLVRFESWVKVRDLGDPMGPFRRLLFNNIKEQETKLHQKYLEVYKGLLEHNKKYAKIFTNKKIKSPELNYEFTDKAHLLAMLLHTGNSSNLEKLLVGRDWGTLNEDETLDASRLNNFIERLWQDGTLQKADYEYLQGIWDMFESFKPDAQKAHRQRYGYYFNEITADEIETPFGTFRGGYVPAKTDSDLVSKADENQDLDAILMMTGEINFPGTTRGFAMERVRQYREPLMMDLSMIHSHINETLRFSYMQNPVADVARLIIDPEFVAHMNSTNSDAIPLIIKPWLSAAVTQSPYGTPSTGRDARIAAKVWNALRKRSSSGIMILNIVNGLQNFTGIPMAAVVVKGRHLRNSLFDYMKAPKQTADQIVEKSDYMKNRLNNQMYEIRQQIDDIASPRNKFQTLRDASIQHGYFFARATQNVNDIVVWVGAYNQAVENGFKEADAVRDADRIVRDTQAENTATGKARIDQLGPFMNVFFMFHSYFNNQLNFMGSEYLTALREFGFKKAAPRLFYITLFGLLIPSIMNDSIGFAFQSDRDKDEDQDGSNIDDFLKMLFMAPVRNTTALVPGGNMALTISNQFNDKPYDDKISLSPAIGSIDQSIRALQSVPNGSKHAISDALTAVTLLTGLPVRPLAKPINYLNKINQGTAQPTGPIDFTRGIITGR